ncbi:hypothetical protein OA93_08100 [Flavobacterium sp. KMS]|uniref:hypothetical protein n=1 Tax=Flavobacterium sp. KMS TaxID=1566023 RepID=UPI00057FA2B2|nr:hypothetical protein [Flavobacterium sp. KMS]KIA98836.1 hypothetical protein OA93_08100 [Flavobacterium sp. KMS]
MKQLSVLLLLMIISSCNAQQPEIFGEKPLNLKNKIFDLNIPVFFPEKYKLKNNPEYYEIPINNNLGIDLHTQLIKKDTLFINDDGTLDNSNFTKNKTSKWIVYTKKNYSSIDTVAVYEKFPFQAINVLTTLDNKLILVSGLIDEISLENSNKFIHLLISDYGKPIITKSKVFSKNIIIYTWVNDDKLLKYCTFLNNESNTIVIEVDKDNSIIKKGDKTPHLEGYFYIAKKEFTNHLIGNINVGDFAFFD